jgi:hypothetical protein
MITIDEFKTLVKTSIEDTDDKSDWYKKWFYGMRISFIVITGAITILSGWQSVDSKSILLNIILLLGAIITALTSCDTLFQIETKKNVYKLMKVELKEVRNEVNLHLDEPERLLKLIEEVLYPKYLNIMSYSKVFIESRETPKPARSVSNQ